MRNHFMSKLQCEFTMLSCLGSSEKYGVFQTLWIVLTILISRDVTDALTGKQMKLIIYQEDDQPCTHGLKVYENAVFTDNFNEISIPTFPGIKGSFCINYCIRTGLCNAIFVAKTNENDFEWCTAYKIERKDINVTALTEETSAHVMDTWEGGAVPEKSELVTLDIDACCPNNCPNQCDCENTEEGSFQCFPGFTTCPWSGPDAEVHLAFPEDTVWDRFAGNMMYTEGIAGQALWLDGSTTVEKNMANSDGCWMDVKTCQEEGFSVAFWFKIISDSGLKFSLDEVGVISAIDTEVKQGWAIELINYESRYYLKFQVHDMQNPLKAAYKEIENDLQFNQWFHYIAVYQYRFPNDEANVLFKIYKNGQLYNNGFSNYIIWAIHEDSVNKLAFGRRYLNVNISPHFNGMLDDLLIFDGSLDDALASKLHANYQN